MEEIWKIIDEAPNYALSNLGRVKHVRIGRVQRVYSYHGLYPHVFLTVSGRTIQRYLDELMWDVFGRRF